jgi:hypothetical protein
VRIGCRRPLCYLTALAMLPACGAHGDHADTTSAGATASTTTATTVVTSTAVAAAGSPQSPGTKNWVDLDVGDCLLDPPPSDPSVVTVAVVDCGTNHAAEVYSRVPVGVNAAIADVADRECAESLSEYTGRPGGSGFVMSYLIDSRQDRTSDNPEPSTVICMLQAGAGAPLTRSAGR